MMFFLEVTSIVNGATIFVRGDLIEKIVPATNGGCVLYMVSSGGPAVSVYEAADKVARMFAESVRNLQKPMLVADNKEVHL